MNEYSHQKITELILKNNFNDKFTNTQTEQILKGVVLPDKDENQNGYAYHFYNPLTNANYLGNELDARSKCIYHYAQYRENDDFIELGRAIHFLEDICTPVHTQYEDTSDSILKLKLHLDFEKELDEYMKKINISSKFLSFEEIINSNYLNVSLYDFINENCYKSVELYYKYKQKYVNSISETFENAYCIVTNFIKNYALKNTINCIRYIENLEHKKIGVLIYTFVKLTEKIKYFDVATLKQDYKLRLIDSYATNPYVLIFKKGGTLKNYVLENVLDFSDPLYINEEIYV